MTENQTTEPQQQTSEQEAKNSVAKTPEQPQPPSSQPEAASATKQPQIDCSRPGELLRKAREAKGLTQLEVAKKLNFLPIYVPYLEEENFEPLHSATFIKGYLRAYARFLEIDADEVLHCFASHYPELAVQEAQQPVEIMKPDKPGSSLAFKLFSLLVILGLLAIVIAWWQSRATEPLTSINTSDSIQVETREGITLETPLAASSEADLTTLAPAEDQPAEDFLEEPPTAPALNPKAPSNANSSSSANSFTGDPLTATRNQPNLIAFTFSAECWIEARDSSGQLLHANLMQAGEQILLEGEPPFRMVFGYGPAAQIYYAGQEVDFSARIRSNGYASVQVD